MLATRSIRNPVIRLQAIVRHYSRIHDRNAVGKLVQRHRPGRLLGRPNDRINARLNPWSPRLIHARWLCAAKPPNGDPKDKNDNDIKVKIVGGKGATTANVPAQVIVPDYFPEVPCLTVSRSPVYPLFVKVIEVTNKELIQLLLRRFKIGQPYAGVFLKKDKKNTSDVVHSLDEIYPIGTFVKVGDYAITGDKLRMFVQGHRRIHLQEIIEGQPAEIITENETGETVIIKSQSKESQVEETITKQDEEQTVESDSGKQEPLLMITSENWAHLPYDKDPELKTTIKAISQEIMDTVRKLIKLNPVYYESLQHLIEANRKMVEDPNHLADFAASLTTSEPEELQAVLAEQDIRARLLLSLELLKKECALAELQHQIGKEVEEKNVNMQRKYLLQEQLKIIKRELGIEKDDKDAIMEKYRERLKDKTVPEDAQKAIDEELSRLSVLDSHSQEFGVIRNYLDWLTIMPWGQYSTENLEINKAKQILNEDHYGLDDIKDRILEFIAVGQLKKSVHGKIICFVGPPGVGKTSIGKSIARALNREFFRFSVGGMTNVAEIKGHRRTYVGAMPGKVIQCFKKTNTSNPVILIDEVDKISTSYRGDPSSALLEVLDPEQNVSFLDHYLDVPVDLSNVLFICTANVLETIPGPLQDRMEVINVSGYISNEKIAIAKRHLIPVAQNSCGIQDRNVSLSEDAVRALVESYCRESGVRNLQKHIEKIFRKAALKIVQGTDEITVDNNNLEDFVGQPVFKSDKIYESTPPGVVMGLAWTALGGSTLYIETVSNTVYENDSKSQSGIELTGQLGDVMKESSRIAYTYAKHFVSKIDEDNRLFSRAGIHLHVPEGATPKDGPSAGCTITTALISLAIDKPVRQNFAMTGEISLTGKVLPVGGIKEKLIAARRAGVDCIVLPAGNNKEFKELHSSVTEGLDIHFAETYNDVYNVAFESTCN
ncbi:uncharacterized protein TRIADDRAFT_38259 [Trichoplax adhaerens]|uniref:Lon protease homolog, mitochondrial n=1 Tax=Trichoplax adhaerens TaxID=10228 RepID=B3S7Y4_TRIAD|nr:hypothetical protein TRIADDRAFT_38259 [Trichoplax adhaerens]EDV21094.1 hypothetical protein TRIADDRAFT_38259 [Trichoplax adhaerens]|eukprot:XP_002116424.1 hypothetical protein TRIADDRAFT_38259 [Trichoplax adhaerens]